MSASSLPRPITARELITALYENVTFPPGIASKRFVRDTANRPPDAPPLSERAERYAWRIAYIYRRQLPKEIAAEAVARKVDHVWSLDGEGRYQLYRCDVCGHYMHGNRDRNAPCSGPPEPKAIKTPKRKECSGTRGAVAVAESPSVAPQESLFDGHVIDSCPTCPTTLTTGSQNSR